MTSIVRTGDQDQNKLEYIATAAFNNAIFSYTVTYNSTTYRNVGVLATLPTATAANCPRGRILRANGKRLYPDANPGVSNFMVGVYDAQSQLSGFIDPNTYLFAVFNADKPLWLPDTVAYPVDGLGLQKGQPVLTSGDVIAGKQIYSTGVTALTAITADGAATAQSIDPSLGQTYTFTVSPPTAVASIQLDSLTPAVGALVRIFITATTAFNTTITFGTNMLSAGTLIVTAAAGPATRYFVITFFSPDGVNLYEVSRTAAQA
jgi:hypothetical protein